MRFSLAVKSSCFFSVAYIVSGIYNGSDWYGSKILFRDPFEVYVELIIDLDFDTLDCLVEIIPDRAD